MASSAARLPLPALFALLGVLLPGESEVGAAFGPAPAIWAAPSARCRGGDPLRAAWGQVIPTEVTIYGKLGLEPPFESQLPWVRMQTLHSLEVWPQVI